MRLDRMSVDCASRTVSWTKTMSRPMASLPPSWAQDEAVKCGTPLYRGLNVTLAKQAWQFVEAVTFADGKQLTLNANCSAYGQ